MADRIACKWRWGAAGSRRSVTGWSKKSTVGKIFCGDRPCEPPKARCCGPHPRCTSGTNPPASLSQSHQVFLLAPACRVSLDAGLILYTHTVPHAHERDITFTDHRKLGSSNRIFTKTAMAPRRQERDVYSVSDICTWYSNCVCYICATSVAVQDTRRLGDDSPHRPSN